jgi:hypothetical protein
LPNLGFSGKTCTWPSKANVIHIEADNWDVYLCENSHSSSKVKVPTIIEELYVETALTAITTAGKIPKHF